MGSADECAGCAIGLSRHAAGIDHDYIGVRSLSFTAPGRAQSIGDSLAIGPCSAAAEVLDVK